MDYFLQHSAFSFITHKHRAGLLFFISRLCFPSILNTHFNICSYLTKPFSPRQVIRLLSSYALDNGGGLSLLKHHIQSPLMSLQFPRTLNHCGVSE